MSTEYYTGTSGWSYRHWKGVFYPEKLAQNRWLQFYADRFTTVEINMTFYRTPGDTAVRNWFGNTGDDFIFTLKAPRTITHLKRIEGIEESLAAFYGLLGSLKHKARCILFQMPPSFHRTPENMERAGRFMALLDPRFDHAIEFRHRSWWDDECYALLDGRCAFCFVDGLGMPRDLVVTAGHAYIRFHGGRYDTLYDDDELQRYAGRLTELAEEKQLKRIYIYFNNDSQGFAVKNALTFKEMILHRS